MKAYMSETRRGGIDPVGIARTYSNVGRDVVEARAILAETEPRVPCRDVFNVGRTSNSEYSNIGQLALCHEPYKALAASLAAILPVLDELEAEANYSAEFGAPAATDTCAECGMVRPLYPAYEGAGMEFWACAPCLDAMGAC